MADLTPTAANVQHAAGATLVTGIASTAITAGMSVYLDANGQATPAQNDSTAAIAAAVGIAVNDAPGAGQPVSYQKAGNIDLGDTLAIGETYAVGAGAGAIAPETDVGSGDYNTTLGVATTASNLKMAINVSGVAHA